MKSTVADYYDELFSKRFEFKSDSSWSLPNKVYGGEPFSISEFQRRKQELNEVKEQLSGFELSEWSQFTKSRDPSTHIVKMIRLRYKPEIITQAWCKFYECLCEFNVISEAQDGGLSSVHLCEAPGAFIGALNHYLKTHHPEIDWQWTGMTFNPDYEGNCKSTMIPDDRLIRFTRKKWFFGSDLTGDMTKYHNHLAILNLFKDKKVNLITADGSIDCMFNPGDQEIIVEFLHYCEVVTALKILADGGNFILKMFTMFEHSSICLVYLLNCCFENVNVFKPCTSKSGNSEVYVICLNYNSKILTEDIFEKLTKPYKKNKIDNSMFDLSDINMKFIEQISECSRYFMDLQIKTINENVRTFKINKNSVLEMKRIKSRNTDMLNIFLDNYNIEKIRTDQRIVETTNLNKIYFSYKDEVDYLPDLCTKFSVDLLKKNFTIEIKLGKHIVNLRYSKYHPIKNYSYFICKNSSQLVQSIIFKLSPKNIILSYNDFIHSYGVSAFHKIFFETLLEKLNYFDNKNIIILAIPLLTNFLVGLVFLLSNSFKTVWFIKNTIVFKEPIQHRLDELKLQFNQIKTCYSKLNQESQDFVEDILQIVDLDCINNGIFYKSICNYNAFVLRNVHIPSL